MNGINKAMIGAMVVGLMAGSTALAKDAKAPKAKDTAAAAKEGCNGKDSCKGKEGCNGKECKHGKDCKHHDKDKNGCGGKEGCGSKEESKTGN